ncbi:glycosyltransferase [Dysgonomonas sp. 216]|uniref:glycosyltransferase n=1 Tax=Dysgonomonas sp. 216 TaxID=2302934 RepID=UPI0013D61683|nr:glycosyltransferase [Dysgonomonas sp. 216]NDW19181.1 glycosyltransferase [Dysgonomonas sp. 216]
MKILNVISSMDPKAGGVCQVLRNNIPEQKRIGVYNEVICFDAADEDFLKQENITIHAIGPAKGPYAYCPELQTWMKNNLNRFDVVIIHGLWLYHSYGAYTAWAKFKKKNTSAPKLFVMPHGMLDPYFQRAKERRLKAIRNWIFWKIIERKIINNSDGLLFTCEDELLLARETFSPYHPVLELNVGLGIQTPPSYNEKTMKDAFFSLCPQAESQPFLLFLSRIHPKKGVDLLIKAYIQLKDRGLNLPKLVIAGPGLETPYGKELTDLVKDRTDIFFPGMLTGDAKWSAFYNCEAFVLPSHQENFGIAIVEAMACSKAVLISNKVNIWREIEKGGGGIVESDTLEDITKMLEQWGNLSTLEKTMMGVKAKETFQIYFSVKETATRMIDVIKSV